MAALEGMDMALAMVQAVMEAVVVRMASSTGMAATAI